MTIKTGKTGILKLGDGIMEISKETFSKMNTDSKLDVIFDIQIASDAKIRSIHDCVKGNGEVWTAQQITDITALVEAHGSQESVAARAALKACIENRIKKYAKQLGTWSDQLQELVRVLPLRIRF